MENAEETFQILERFSKLKQKDIPKELDDYLSFVAKTGDTVYRWPMLKYLFREKLMQVIKDFYESTPSVTDLPQEPNVDPFNYESMKNVLLERLDLFNAAPFTVQRICELLTDPRKQYSRIDKFMRAIEKNILVVSTTEPGRKRGDSETAESIDSVINGDLSSESVDSDENDLTFADLTAKLTNETKEVADAPKENKSEKIDIEMKDVIKEEKPKEETQSKKEEMKENDKMVDILETKEVEVQPISKLVVCDENPVVKEIKASDENDKIINNESIDEKDKNSISIPEIIIDSPTSCTKIEENIVTEENANPESSVPEEEIPTVLSSASPKSPKESKIEDNNEEIAIDSKRNDQSLVEVESVEPEPKKLKLDISLPTSEFETNANSSETDTCEVMSTTTISSDSEPVEKLTETLLENNAVINSTSTQENVISTETEVSIEEILSSTIDPKEPPPPIISENVTNVLSNSDEIAEKPCVNEDFEAIQPQMPSIEPTPKIPAVPDISEPAIGIVDNIESSDIGEENEKLPESISDVTTEDEIPTSSLESFPTEPELPSSFASSTVSTSNIETVTSIIPPLIIDETVTLSSNLSPMQSSETLDMDTNSNLNEIKMEDEDDTSILSVATSLTDIIKPDEVAMEVDETVEPMDQ